MEPAARPERQPGHHPCPPTAVTLRRTPRQPHQTAQRQSRTPDHAFLHGIAETEEGIVYADIDLGMISLAKSVADPSGHYARPDVTRLLLNKTPGDRVIVTKQESREVTRADDDGPTILADRERALTAMTAEPQDD